MALLLSQAVQLAQATGVGAAAAVSASSSLGDQDYGSKPRERPFFYVLGEQLRYFFEGVSEYKIVKGTRYTVSAVHGFIKSVTQQGIKNEDEKNKDSMLLEDMSEEDLIKHKDFNYDLMKSLTSKNDSKALEIKRNILPIYNELLAKTDDIEKRWCLLREKADNDIIASKLFDKNDRPPAIGGGWTCAFLGDDNILYPNITDDFSDKPLNGKPIIISYKTDKDYPGWLKENMYHTMEVIEKYSKVRFLDIDADLTRAPKLLLEYRGISDGIFFDDGTLGMAEFPNCSNHATQKIFISNKHFTNNCQIEGSGTRLMHVILHEFMHFFGLVHIDEIKAADKILPGMTLMCKDFVSCYANGFINGGRRLGIAPLSDFGAYDVNYLQLNSGANFDKKGEIVTKELDGSKCLSEVIWPAGAKYHLSTKKFKGNTFINLRGYADGSVIGGGMGKNPSIVGDEIFTIAYGAEIDKLTLGAGLNTVLCNDHKNDIYAKESGSNWIIPGCGRNNITFSPNRSDNNQENVILANEYQGNTTIYNFDSSRDAIKLPTRLKDRVNLNFTYKNGDTILSLSGKHNITSSFCFKNVDLNKGNLKIGYSDELPPFPSASKCFEKRLFWLKCGIYPLLGAWIALYRSIPSKLINKLIDKYDQRSKEGQGQESLLKKSIDKTICNNVFRRLLAGSAVATFPMLCAYFFHEIDRSACHKYYGILGECFDSYSNMMFFPNFYLTFKDIPGAVSNAKSGVRGKGRDLDSIDVDISGGNPPSFALEQAEGDSIKKVSEYNKYKLD